MVEKNNFLQERKENIRKISLDKALKKRTIKWICDTAKYKYTYNFNWLGRPIIQFPQDIVALQEIIWEVKPDLIIETGIARGGSLIFSASMMELIGGKGQVVGIDIEIRKYNRIKIEKHPMFKRIIMIEGSSTNKRVIEQVKKIVRGKKRVLVYLDSNHTYEHVLKELELYSPFVTKGSYLIVFDTIIEEMSKSYFSDKPWSKGNNPKTAVIKFLQRNKNFVIHKNIPNKLLITVAPDGYLRRIK